jgi:hypothetical protein
LINSSADKNESKNGVYTQVLQSINPSLAAKTKQKTHPGDLSYPSELIRRRRRC